MNIDRKTINRYSYKQRRYAEYGVTLPSDRARRQEGYVRYILPNILQLDYEEYVNSFLLEEFRLTLDEIRWSDLLLSMTALHENKEDIEREIINHMALLGADPRANWAGEVVFHALYSLDKEDPLINCYVMNGVKSWDDFKVDMMDKINIELFIKVAYNATYHIEVDGIVYIVHADEEVDVNNIFRFLKENNITIRDVVFYLFLHDEDMFEDYPEQTALRLKNYYPLDTITLLVRKGINDFSPQGSLNPAHNAVFSVNRFKEVNIIYEIQPRCPN